MYASEHYKTAIQLFHKAKIQTRVEDNPVLWSLSSGLEHLAEAVQQDMNELRGSLAAIARDVKHLK
jgi:hypothetical protein